jgi:hypothetical protein
MQQFLEKKQIPIIPQPPYSPDLILCNFQLFPSHHLLSTEEAEWNATAQHTAIPQEVLLGLAGSTEKMSICQKAALKG